ncbi:MAG: site-2 protease family protein [Chloroflexi bacterium]|nr:site-2 protease family protein [Chloroflexota bacterium]
MSNAIKLFSFRGIDIRVHITFPLILIWAAIQFGIVGRRGIQGAVFGVVVTLILFAIVLLHELGHSIAAQHYKIAVKEIVLLPIGGVAQLSKIPEQPIKELVIAAAGPLVNFGIAIVLGLLLLFFNFDVGLGDLPLTMRSLARASTSSIFAYVFISNILLAVFNLLPAFPLDGGRILRALLATRLSYSRATAIAVSIGQGMAWLLGLWGLLGGGFFMVVVALFILVGASQEGQVIRIRRVFEGLRVEQAYSRSVETLAPDSTLRQAVALTLQSFQSDFPVCEGEKLVGLLTHTKLMEAINRNSPDTFIGLVMDTEIPGVEVRDGLFDVQQQLADLNVDALPVLEDGMFLGLITSRDLNEAYRFLSKRPDLLTANQAA